MEVVSRILALDYGKKRIGLAVSDPLRITAQGMETFTRTRVRDDIERLANIVRELDVELVVIGDPVHLSGDESAASQRVREFGSRLQAAASVPVAYWDERLTSFAAHEVLDEAGVPPRERKGMVDRIAAVVLLRDYLEAHPA